MRRGKSDLEMYIKEESIYNNFYDEVSLPKDKMCLPDDKKIIYSSRERLVKKEVIIQESRNESDTTKDNINDFRDGH